VNRVEIEVLAMMRERADRGPRLVDDFHRFLEAALALFDRYTEVREVILVIARADAQDQPPAREHVDKRGRLRQMHRVIQRRHQDVGADTNAIGTHRNRRQQRQWARKHALGARVALRHENTVEAAIVHRVRHGYRACMRTKPSDSPGRAAH
jgi:hypothetical protein